jgi:predicted transcriptional regulator
MADVHIVNLTTQIISAYTSHNIVSMKELPDLIRRIYMTLATISSTPSVTEPVVPIEESVKEHAITCLICGNAYQMLKRHLKYEHDMTPDQYRQRWRLSKNYPMVALNYTKIRSDLAKQIGLGRLALPPQTG